MAEAEAQVTYWDSSAILSTLFRDGHSEQAQEWSRSEGVHLLSSLAHAETCAVIARMRRDRLLADILLHAAFEAFEQGPWHRLAFLPAWADVQSLAERWPLRGADLWHLACAVGLREHLPELKLLTFDDRLKLAARGEELLAD